MGVKQQMAGKDSGNAAKMKEARKRLARAEEQLLKFPEYTGQDYDVGESDLHRALIFTATEKSSKAETSSSWVLTLVIGVTTGIFGFCFNQGGFYLNTAKFNSVAKFIQPGGGFIVPYLVLMAFVVLYSFVASLLASYVSPLSAGSGIPEIRCYLNGIHIKGLLTIQTLFAKAFGVIFSIASGLVVGREGPFIHVGAIVGGGIAKLGSISLTSATGGLRMGSLRLAFADYFQTPVDHRDYVAVGTASGVSTAFDAPISGVTFAIEQGASYYNYKMLWHSFLGAGVAMYTSVVLNHAVKNGGGLLSVVISGSQAFTRINTIATQSRYWYYTWEMLVFVIMGSLGGALGAAMVMFNQQLAKIRQRFIPKEKPHLRVLEVVLIAVVTSTVWLVCSYASPCAPVPPPLEPRDHVLFPQLWCPVCSGIGGRCCMHWAEMVCWC